MTNSTSSALTTLSTTPAPTAPAPTVTPQVQPHTKSGMSPTEGAAMAEWIREDLAKGNISKPQADRAFDQLQIPADQRELVDTRTEEQCALDHEFPAAKPNEYVIRFGTPGEEIARTPELKAFDQSARTWLSGAEFDRTLGNSLVTVIDRVVQQTLRMTPEQLDYYGQMEYQKLEKAYGPALEEKLQATGRMVHELDAKHPGLKNLLKSKGIGDNAIIASMLIQQAERWHARPR